MPDWAERIWEELRRYDRRSMVGDTVIDHLLYIGSKLRMVRSGWDRWKEGVLDEINHLGENGEGIYELIAEDYLSDRELHYVWLLANDASIAVESEDNKLTITLQGDTEGKYHIILHDMSGEVVLTYANNLGDNGKTQRVDDYVASICEPSFEESKCNKD